MMNDPIQILFDEHEVIRLVVDAARKSSGYIGKDDSRYEQIVRKLLNFFRNYADRYHHYKEEIILFPEMCKRNELLQNGVIQEMLNNHTEFREMLGSIENFIREKNYMRANQQMEIYCEALLDHISVENDEVFQIAESIFQEQELDSMYFRFADCDKELGEGGKLELAKMANEIHEELTGTCV